MRIPYDNTTTPNEPAPDRRYKTERTRRKWKQQVTSGTGVTGTSKALRPGWTVMGSSHSQKNFAVSSLQTTFLTHIFVFLLLVTAANSAKSSKKQKCAVDRCGQYFRVLSDMTNDLDKCRQLFSHRDCLVGMSDVCRGDLLYHTSVHVNGEKLKELHCDEILNNLPTETSPNPERTNQCVYAGKPKFKLCSLFGDPHVRTFSDKCHTCKANGSWSLISNDYLVVKATNSLLKGPLQATAISKLVVNIRGSGECAKQKTYLAEIGSDLSATFTDGSTHTGLEKSVNVSVKEQGKEIQIDIRFIATTIVIRNVGSHLTFSIQMPEEIVNNPVGRRQQMCVRGCSKHQRIRLKKEILRLGVEEKKKEFLTAEKYTEQEARRRCRNVLLGLDEEEAIENGREKRSVAKRKRNDHRRRETEIDASAKSFWQLSNSDPRGNSRSSSRSRKAKNHRRRGGRRRLEYGYLEDAPVVENFGGKSGVGRGTNFYFEACVFDLMTTGDVTYASSARGAFDDVTRFHRSGKKAKGASIKAIDNYPIVSTTSPRKTTKSPPIGGTNATKGRGGIGSTTSGNGSRPLSVNLYLLIFCLFSTTHIFNVIHFHLISNFYIGFCKRRTAAA